MELISKRSSFATWKFLAEKSEIWHPEITELKRASDFLKKKDYVLAGKCFLIMWQDVQTMQQNMYSMSTFVGWNLDMFISNSASIRIKDLEELGITLIHDAAMAFFLAKDEPYNSENICRYKDRRNESPQWPKQSSHWPKLGSAVRVESEGKTFEEGTGVDLVLEDLKYPLDILLDSCTTNQKTAEMLGYYYFIRSAAHDMKSFYSADIECIIGQSSCLAEEIKLPMLKHALESASENSDMGNKE